MTKLTETIDWKSVHTHLVKVLRIAWVPVLEKLAGSIAWKYRLEVSTHPYDKALELTWSDGIIIGALEVAWADDIDTSKAIEPS